MTLEEKIELGRREGVEIGIKKGRDENRCEMIRNMINNDFSVEMIAKAAGTTEEELHEFAREHGVDLK